MDARAPRVRAAWSVRPGRPRGAGSLGSATGTSPTEVDVFPREAATLRPRREPAEKAGDLLAGRTVADRPMRWTAVAAAGGVAGGIQPLECERRCAPPRSPRRVDFVHDHPLDAR